MILLIFLHIIIYILIFINFFLLVTIIIIRNNIDITFIIVIITTKTMLIFIFNCLQCFRRFFVIFRYITIIYNICFCLIDICMIIICYIDKTFQIIISIINVVFNFMLYYIIAATIFIMISSMQT